MASKLEDRKKIMNDLHKVVNLKIFKSIQKINQYESDVKTIIQNIENIKSIKNFLAKKSSFFDVYYKQVKNPKKLMIFMQSVDDSNIDVYSDKKVEEYIAKNTDENVKSWIIGPRLFDHLLNSKIITDEQKATISFFGDYNIDEKTKVINFSKILNEVADYSLLAFDNKDFTQIDIYYSDIKESGNIKSTRVLPMIDDSKKRNKKGSRINRKDKEDSDDDIKTKKSDIYIIYSALLKSIRRKFSNLKFYSEIEEINSAILKFAISSNIKYTIIGFLLNVEIRKLFSLQEEVKKLDENIEEINALIKAFRQEKITREMLMIAAAKFAKDKRMEELIKLELEAKGVNYAK